MATVAVGVNGSVTTMTSLNRTSGASSTNRAVYPVADQLAGTMALDLLLPGGFDEGGGGDEGGYDDGGSLLDGMLCE